MKPSKRTSQSLRSTLCLLLALSMVALVAPLPGAGAGAAFAEQQEGDAPKPQDAPSPDNPDEGLPADPAAEPTNGTPADRVDDPADDPATNPTDGPAAAPAGDADSAPASSSDAQPAPAADSGGPEVRGPGEYLITKLADEAIDFADSAIVATLDYAAEKTGYNIFSKAGDLLTLPSGKGDRELEKLCNEILDELAVVDEDIKNLGDQLESDILHLESLISTNQWATDRRTLTELAQKYTDAYNDYQHYLQAAADLSEAKESGDPNAAMYETKMQGYLENFTDKFDPTKVGDPISFASDIRKLASVCCKAYPSFGVTADAGDLPQLFLLQEANSVCNQTQAFEHQKFAALTAQANECMAAFARLSYVNRLWVDYQASVALDKKAPAKYLTEQETVANQVVQAVNDLSAQMQEYGGGLMRPYDFEVLADINYSNGGTTHMYGHYLAFSRPKDLKIGASWTRPSMLAYQGKPIGSSTPFLLMQTDHGPLKHNDLIVYQRDSEHTPRGTNYWDYSTMNQDWYNLVVTRDANYRLIDDASSFAKLVSPQSYALSGGQDLIPYLVNYGGMDASLLPPSTTTALTMKWKSAATTHDVSEHFNHPGMVGSWCFTYDYVADLTHYRLDQSSKELSKRMATANTSPYHYDEKLRNQPMLVMMEGVSSQTHTLGIEQTPETSVHVQDARGNLTASGAWLNSAQRLTITVASGNFGELQLVDRFGNVLDTLLTAEAFDLCADEHGIVTLSTTMPYQDCMVRVVDPGQQPASPADPAACALGGFDDGQLFEPGASVSFAASGTEEDAINAPWGTQRLRPSAWSVALLTDSDATVIADGAWTAHPFEGMLPTGGMVDGTYRLTATFARERFENGAWVDVGAAHALGRTFTIHDQHVITGPEEPAGPAVAPGGTGVALAPTGDWPAGWLAMLGALLTAAIGAISLSFHRLRDPKGK